MSNIFSRIFTKRKPTEEIEYANPVSIINAALDSIIDQWQLTDDRKTVYDDITRMLKSDEYGAEAIDILVNDTLPIKSMDQDIIGIEAENDTLYNRLEEILQRSRLGEQLRNLLYKWFKSGNEFLEFVLNESNRLEYVHHIPQSWSVYRNVDEHGMLRSGDPTERKINVCAYDQRTDSGEFLAGFRKYQILHLRMMPYDDNGHGTPFLAAARRNWIKLQITEDSKTIARLVRAYLKLVHQVPFPKELTGKKLQRAIGKYKDSLITKQITSVSDAIVKRSRVNMPLNVGTDYILPFVPGTDEKGSITAIDPHNAQLANIEDIKYDLNRYMARLKVPKARLANEGDVRAKATMFVIDSAYARTITGYQIDVIGLIVSLLDRALLFEGYPVWDRKKVDYRITLPSAFVQDEEAKARTEMYRARTYDTYIKGKLLSRDWVRQKELGLSDTENADEIDQIKQEQDEFPASGGMGGFGLEASLVRSMDEITELRKELQNDNGKKKNRMFAL